MKRSALLLLALPLISASCATRGSIPPAPLQIKAVDIVTKPEGASVSILDYASGETIGICEAPCAIKMDTRKLFTVAASLEGVEDYASDGAYFETPRYLNEIYLDMDGDDATNMNLDRRAKALVRIPPRMPMVNRSGNCNLVFDVNAMGKPENIRATHCTDSAFAAPAISSVQKWRFNPAIRSSVPVADYGLETKISFQLTDRGRRVLPNHSYSKD